jgi:thioredoxin-like negative regulator of GroEL
VPATRLTQFDFHHTLAETAGVSLVYFSAPGCGACRQLKQILESHPQEFALLNLFEVDAQQDMALTREFEVFHLPALFLFKDGHYHAPIHSEPLVPSLLAAVEAALAAAPQEAP